MVLYFSLASDSRTALTITTMLVREVWPRVAHDSETEFQHDSNLKLAPKRDLSFSTFDVVLMLTCSLGLWF